VYILTTFFPLILIFVVAFSAPLFHMVLAGVQAVGKLLRRAEAPQES
jgi:hypothetical protein